MKNIKVDEKCVKIMIFDKNQLKIMIFQCVTFIRLNTLYVMSYFMFKKVIKNVKILITF